MLVGVCSVTSEAVLLLLRLSVLSDYDEGVSCLLVSLCFCVGICVFVPGR